MTESVTASVIILTWNGRSDIEACLSAVLAQTYSDYEIIVVDNASEDGTPDFISEQYPQVRLIRNAQNLGFAAGNNIGLHTADGDILVLLNQDTEVDVDWLTSLVSRFATDSQIGIVGGKALYPDGLIQHAGGTLDKQGNGRHLGLKQPDQGQYSVAADVDYITGATLAISRQVLTKVGTLDEAFAPAYYEDVDWCYRVRQAGYRVVYEPKAVLIHKEASVLVTDNHEGYYFLQRNRLRFLLKHWAIERLAKEFLPLELAWIEQISQDNPMIIGAVARIYLFHLLHLHSLVSVRQKIHVDALEETDQIADLLLTLRQTVTVNPFDRTSSSQWAQDRAEETALLEALHQSWAIVPHQFKSPIPIVGSWIARIREAWYRVASAWVIQSLTRQQNEINAKLLSVLIKQDRRLTKLEQDKMILAAYISEGNRELTDIGQAITQTKLYTNQE